MTANKRFKLLFMAINNYVFSVGFHVYQNRVKKTIVLLFAADKSFLAFNFKLRFFINPVCKHNPAEGRNRKQQNLRRQLNTHIPLIENEINTRVSATKQ